MQGFSEPNAGSDLGSLACRAVRDGDHFIVNGQKTWTSYAQVADWIFLLVRTNPDASKYKGITCLLVDMKSEGVSVRPLRMMSGDSVFNEVFFSDVKVPVDNVLGEIDGGWKVGITALMHERMNLGGAVHRRALPLSSPRSSIWPVSGVSPTIRWSGRSSPRPASSWRSSR